MNDLRDYPTPQKPIGYVRWWGTSRGGRRGDVYGSEDMTEYKTVPVYADPVNPPPGFILVPLKPSIDMLENGSIASNYDLSQEQVARIYRAVINAYLVHGVPK